MGDGICTVCTQGKYQNEKGQDSCKECPEGRFLRYNANNGPVIAYHDGLADCTSCEAGKYQDVTGQLICKDCDAGKYQDVTGQLICKNCDAGKYQDQTGESSCKNCPAGKSSTAGGTCTDCPAGKSSTAGGTCTDCEGKYVQVKQLTGQTQCHLVQCSGNQYFYNNKCVDSCPSNFVPNLDYGQFNFYYTKDVQRKCLQNYTKKITWWQNPTNSPTSLGKSNVVTVVSTAEAFA